MSSTDTPGDRSEAEDCYTEQRRLEEELLAQGPGEEEAVVSKVNPRTSSM
jgi:hypothetical protein